jgi:hypothetical protein
MPDTNVKNAVYSGGNTQWYYFAVTNMRAGVEYTLNIVNLVKSDSLYRQGMQPALFSTKDYQVGTHDIPLYAPFACPFSVTHHRRVEKR